VLYYRVKERRWSQMTPEEIKKIRQATGLTQEDFAHELGTSVATINRWENGRNQPGRMAVRLLKQMEEKAKAE